MVRYAPGWFHKTLVLTLYYIFSEHRKRTGIRYWFPPPHVWNSQKCGHAWMEWTQENEAWFEALWKGYQSGTGGQPKSAEAWSQALRGPAPARIFQDKSKQHAESMCNQYIPIAQGPVPLPLLERISD